MKSFHLLVLLVFLLPAAAEATRVAVLSRPELREEALVLTTALSNGPDFEVLERDEIARVLGEQGLEQTGSEVQVGKLLKADGLVLLEKMEGALWLRLVVVDSGAILTYSSTSYPLEGLEEWSAARAVEIARIAPKLRSGHEQVIPVSLMRLTSPFSGSGERLFEENASSLFSALLSASPKVVVLERSRLQDAAAEKVFGSEKIVFATSAWMIDGTISRQTSGYTLSLRLQPPGDAVAKHLRLEASDLGVLVESASRKVLESMGAGSTSRQSSGEARRLEDEAVWLAGNKLWKQAIRSIEASIVLGNESPEALQARWRMYAIADNLNDTERLSFMARALELYREAVLKAQLPAEDTDRDDNLQRSRWRHVRLHQSAPAPFSNERPVPEWMTLLKEASRKLINVERKNAPVVEALTLDELRTQTRLLFDALVEQSADLSLTPAEDDRLPVWDASISRDVLRIPLYPHEFRLYYGRAWEKDPADYYAYVQTCLKSELRVDPSFYQRALNIISHFNACHGVIPRKKMTDERVQALGSFFNESGLRQKVASAYILCQSGRMRDGLKIVEELKDEVIAGRLSVDYMGWILRFSPMSIQTWNDEGVSRETVGEIQRLLATLLEHNIAFSDQMYQSLGSIPFSPQEAQALLSGVLAFEQQHPISDDPRRKGAFDHFVRQLSGKIEPGKVSPEEIAKARVAPLPPLPNRRPRKGQPQTAANSVPIVKGTPWIPRDYDRKEAEGKIRYMLPDGDQLWVQVEFAGSNRREIRRQIIQVKLPSMSSTVMMQELAQAGGSPFRKDGPVFAVIKDAVYFRRDNGVGQLREGKVSTLDLPDLKAPYFWEANGDLYIADHDGVLLKYSVGTGRYTLIASALRRPPENKLDERNDLRSVSRVFATEDGSIVVATTSMLYRFLPDRNDWSQMSLHDPAIPKELWVGRWQNAKAAVGITLNIPSLTETQTHKKPETKRIDRRADRYLPPSSKEKERFRMGIFGDGSLVQEDLWVIVKQLENLYLLKLNVPSDQFTSWPLQLGNPSVEEGAMIGRDYRLVAVPDGFILYEPGASAAWIIRHSDLKTAEH